MKRIPLATLLSTLSQRATSLVYRQPDNAALVLSDKNVIVSAAQPTSQSSFQRKLTQFDLHLTQRKH